MTSRPGRSVRGAWFWCRERGHGPDRLKPGAPTMSHPRRMAPTGNATPEEGIRPRGRMRELLSYFPGISPQPPFTKGGKQGTKSLVPPLKKGGPQVTLLVDLAPGSWPSLALSSFKIFRSMLHSGHSHAETLRHLEVYVDSLPDSSVVSVKTEPRLKTESYELPVHSIHGVPAF